MLKYTRNALMAQSGHGENGRGGNGHHNGNGHTGKAPTKVLTGRNLAHKPRTKTERAFLALDIARGDAVVVGPTLTQAAKLAGVNLDYVHKAARMTAAERHAVETGRRSIHQKLLALPAPAPTVINDAWHQMNAAERQQWVRDNAPELWASIDAVTAPPDYDPFEYADAADFEKPLPEGW
jgi:hypothetical protein